MHDLVEKDVQDILVIGVIFMWLNLFVPVGELVVNFNISIKINKTGQY